MGPWAAAILMLCAAATPALAAGDAQAGHALARVWCSGCHVVGHGESGPDTAPPFATVAERHPNDRGWVRAWLTAPHPPMPNLDLSRQQIDDIVAYLDSLAPASR